MQKQGSSIRDYSSSEIVTSDLIDILLHIKWSGGNLRNLTRCEATCASELHQSLVAPADQHCLNRFENLPAICVTPSCILCRAILPS